MNIFVQTIPVDFDVRLIHEAPDAWLYASRRPGTWHFVHLEVVGGRNILGQFHIPRYAVAAVVDSELAAPGGSMNTPAASSAAAFVQYMYTKQGLADEFLDLVAEDVELLQSARSKVERAGGQYILPRRSSFKGNPVASTSKDLVDAIAFEENLVRRLDPKRFALYSAFCTYRDFFYDPPFPPDIVANMVDSQLREDPGDFADAVIELHDRVQDRVLGGRFWGPGVNVSRGRAVEMLRSGMERLSRAQKAQFALLNGMHCAGLCLPLATVTGLITFETYAQWKTLHFQVDSPEEQLLRAETSYIELLGHLAPERGSGLHLKVDHSLGPPQQ